MFIGREKLKVSIPTEVLLVILSIVASYFGSFKTNFNVEIVDNVPTGYVVAELTMQSVNI